MIQQIAIISKSGEAIPELKIGVSKIVIDCLKIPQLSSSFDIKVTFDHSIKRFRNQDYTWVDLKKTRIANEFSPKIIQLDNGFYIQANCHLGIWETNPKNPKELLWRFNPEFSKPLKVY